MLAAVHNVEKAVLCTAEIRDGLVAEWRIYSDVEEAKRRAHETPDVHRS